jgi:hypothetical protein
MRTVRDRMNVDGCVLPASSAESMKDITHLGRYLPSLPGAVLLVWVVCLGSPTHGEVKSQLSAAQDTN